MSLPRALNMIPLGLRPAEWLMWVRTQRKDEGDDDEHDFGIPPAPRGD